MGDNTRSRDIQGHVMAFRFGMRNGRALLEGTNMSQGEELLRIVKKTTSLWRWPVSLILPRVPVSPALQPSLPTAFLWPCF